MIDFSKANAEWNLFEHVNWADNNLPEREIPGPG